ncbi:hypothetical protein [Helicobacter sp. MIT 14-3879]|uniref:hypothetical protein n=1 Tax=Helicobacter sp. MIT 14-3879 TaxID=2040649 RepID=UPI000E1EAA7C|nr:hypothetical protein [Helicobacter sp. MIT 14-3879]
MNEKIKLAIKNAIININYNVDFTPEYFLQILCKELKALGLEFDECQWYNLWSSKFNEDIRKELNNYPIKTRNDFINTLSHIYKNKLESQSSDTNKILQKALKLLRESNLIDVDEKTPLNIIDSKLNQLLNSSSKLSSSILNIEALKFKKLDDDALLYEIDEYIVLNLPDEALRRLCKALYEILISEGKDNVLIYGKNSILVIPNNTIEISMKLLDSILETKTFIYKNQKIHLKVNVKKLKIKDLI